jgi:hypothetical protein
MSQTLDITTLTPTPTRHPNTTSPTLCNPSTMPTAEESFTTAAAMTTAAVIGA